MANKLIRTSQPQGVARIDWSNPITRKLSAAWNFTNDCELLSGAISTIGTGAARSTTPNGIAIDVSGISNLDRYVLKTQSGADDIGASDFTVIINFTLSSLNSGYALIGRWNTGASPATNDWYLGGNSLGTSITFSVCCGSTIYTADIAEGLVINVPYTFVGRRTGTTIEVFKIYNAAIVKTASTTNAGITTVNFNAGRKLKLGEIDLGAGYNAQFSTTSTSLFKRSLSNAEIRSLSDNPWQIFAPNRSVLNYASVASSGSTGTLAKTTAADTSAASGSTTIIGSLAKTNAADTSAASGSTTIIGTLAKTAAADTVVASGSVGSNITGTLARTNAVDTVVASGSTTVIGSVAKTSLADTVVASGSTTIIGTVARTNAADTVVAVGAAGSITGTVNVTNAADTLYTVAPSNGAGTNKRKKFQVQTENRIIEVDSLDEVADLLKQSKAKREKVIDVKLDGLKVATPSTKPNIDYKAIEAKLRASIQAEMDDEDDILMLLL
jgi:hypothetical protein